MYLVFIQIKPNICKYTIVYVINKLFITFFIIIDKVSKLNTKLILRIKTKTINLSFINKQ